MQQAYGDLKAGKSHDYIINNLTELLNSKERHAECINIRFLFIECVNMKSYKLVEFFVKNDYYGGMVKHSLHDALFEFVQERSSCSEAYNEKLDVELSNWIDLFSCVSDLNKLLSVDCMRPGAKATSLLSLCYCCKLIKSMITLLRIGVNVNCTMQYHSIHVTVLQLDVNRLVPHNHVYSLNIKESDQFPRVALLVFYGAATHGCHIEVRDLGLEFKKWLYLYKRMDDAGLNRQLITSVLRGLRLSRLLNLKPAPEFVEKLPPMDDSRTVKFILNDGDILAPRFIFQESNVIQTMLDEDDEVIVEIPLPSINILDFTHVIGFLKEYSRRPGIDCRWYDKFREFSMPDLMSLLKTAEYLDIPYLKKRIIQHIRLVVLGDTEEGFIKNLGYDNKLDKNTLFEIRKESDWILQEL